MHTTAEMMKLAFRDELKKIAFTRSGRKPIGIERLLERESESDVTPSNAFTNAKVPADVFKSDIEKVSNLKAGLAYAAAGGATTLALQKANRDRRMGKAMRMQQNSSY